MDTLVDLKDLQVLIKPYPSGKAKLLKDWTQVNTVADITNRDFEADRRLQTRTASFTRLLSKRASAKSFTKTSPVKTTAAASAALSASTSIALTTPAPPLSLEPQVPPLRDEKSPTFLYDRPATVFPNTPKQLYQPNNSLLRPLLAPILKDTDYDPSTAISPDRQTRSRYKNSLIRPQKITTPKSKTMTINEASSKKKKVHFAEEAGNGNGDTDGDYTSQKLSNGSIASMVNGGGSPKQNGYNPSKNNMDDLIPPDIDRLGYTCDINVKDDNDGDSDSISTRSSDESFYSCDDDKVSR